MRVLLLRCGDIPLSVPPGVTVHDLPAVPSRQDLRFLDEAAAATLPVDPTPSLDEIAAQPDVEHLTTPAIAPQAEFLSQRLRVVVAGTDAALSAVLTRMMRADYLWAEVGFVPVAPSTAAQNWGLSTSLDMALLGDVHPVPLIRTDAGIAVAGSATITDWNEREITGEIIVDDHVLVRHESGAHGHIGARLVPMTDAPGIAAVRIITASRRLFRRTPQELFDAPSLTTGRAVQAGGPDLAVTVDGIRHKRPLERVTFYRHLRDLQIVRPL
ncbi:hypothetical protein CATRI_11800 [Corynebacterium atrinae]|uniref:hypothetical protein n=1 Tax=Corynebacterium atrinae TaxID=1336740 RepID=UPI0025B48825|nr:hypothetical protein [Corynebacterium atrinae]WJY64409.1 hypothetical protein CATRI_11800 [Corynebacterium atrinae]